MPAMPIALSRAPIVVGIRQTSSETRTIPVWGAPLKIASGCSVTTASMKMIVRLASRMLSAISLGVFCRAAPSTSAIIRSRKVSPAFAVIRTTIRSESTRVPPVTADRSPPASRITGADSPVIADSSTLAMPSITSPSLGIRSPASHTTRSSTLSSAEGTSRSPPSTISRAFVSWRLRRKAAAWALPRPSATASARLAKMTVAHSHTTISQAKVEGWTTASTVDSAAPTSTTNITGLRIIVRGLSLAPAAGSWVTSIRASSSPAPTRGAPCGASGATVWVVIG